MHYKKGKIWLCDKWLLCAMHMIVVFARGIYVLQHFEFKKKENIPIYEDKCLILENTSI